MLIELPGCKERSTRIRKKVVHRLALRKPCTHLSVWFGGGLAFEAMSWLYTFAFIVVSVGNINLPTLGSTFSIIAWIFREK